MSEKLFVGGLSFSTSTEGLRAAIARFGAVDSAAVMTDRETGRSRGFGFVEMATTEEAERAISSLNGSVGATCSQRAWPNFETSCLRAAGSKTVVREARLVTPEHR